MSARDRVVFFLDQVLFGAVRVRSQRGGRRAFSLIELLVVIAVVAVLISLLVPALRRARAAAFDTRSLANLRSIGQAVVLYANDNKERYPISSHTSGSLASEASWLQSLQPYGVVVADRFCPRDLDRASKAPVVRDQRALRAFDSGAGFQPGHQEASAGRANGVRWWLSDVPRPSQARSTPTSPTRRAPLITSSPTRSRTRTRWRRPWRCDDTPTPGAIGS